MMGASKIESWRQFWVGAEIYLENGSGFLLGYGWTTFFALFFILFFHCVKHRFFFLCKRRRVSSASSAARPLASGSSVHAASSSRDFRISEIVSEGDLKFLIQNLDDNPVKNEKWENVICKRNNHISYTAKCCRPKDAPLKYLSVTVFENCSLEVLRDFYMDNDYRKQWDKTVVEHEQLQVDMTSGVEIGRTIKKFPFLTPREYILAWRLWQGEDGAFYCFTKECLHPSAPRQKKYVRVQFFRSGWRIRKVLNRDACEIKLFHQEDAGLNVEMAKLAFAKGIWSYVCKMDSALRKYSLIKQPQRGQSVTAISLIQKVPAGLEIASVDADTVSTNAASTRHGLHSGEGQQKKLLRRPSGKVLANGLLLLGGVICLSRGHSSLGAKVAMAYILTKLRKHDASSSQTQTASS